MIDVENFIDRLITAINAEAAGSGPLSDIAGRVVFNFVPEGTDPYCNITITDAPTDGWYGKIYSDKIRVKVSIVGSNSTQLNGITKALRIWLADTKLDLTDQQHISTRILGGYPMMVARNNNEIRTNSFSLLEFWIVS